jgi:hypothetical protein
MQPVVEVGVLAGQRVKEEEERDSKQHPAHGVAWLMPGHDHTDHAERQVQPELAEDGERERVVGDRADHGQQDQHHHDENAHGQRRARRGETHAPPGHADGWSPPHGTPG